MIAPVSVHTHCTGTWPLQRDLALHAQLGVTLCGIHQAKLVAAGVEAAAEALRGAGVAVNEVTSLGRFSPADPAAWPAERAELETAMEQAAAVGARCLVVAPGPRGELDWPEAAARFAEAVAPALRRGRDLGVAVAVETVNPTAGDRSFVHTCAQLVEVGRVAGVEMVVDLVASYWDPGLLLPFESAPDRVLTVQVADLAFARRDGSRCPPGEGDLPLGHLLRAIRAAGWSGSLELEYQPRHLGEAEYPAAIARSLDALRHLDAGA